MEILDYIRELEEAIESSPKVPMTGKRIVDEEILEIIDKIKVVIPEEFIKARRIIEEREQIIIQARYEGERIIKEKENYLAKMSDDCEITRRAQQLSEKMINDARRNAQETVEGANEYADEILSKLEHLLASNLQIIQKGREKLEELKKSSNS